MNKTKHITLSLAIITQLIVSGCSSSTTTAGLPNYTIASKTEALEVLNRANRYWQTNHPEHGNAFWHRAAYHTGNMAAYEVTGNKEYLAYSYAWAERNEWKGAKSDDKKNWKYSYGESDDHVLFGDWQICFQVYADLYRLKPEDQKIARALEVMGYQMSTPQNDYLWWADGLYMVMPVMTKLHNITGDKRYLEKLYEYFHFAFSALV
jgi:unsaturated rhamnogalacturonyl hydrolase